MIGLGIHTLIDGELNWLACGDDAVDVNGYFECFWEGQENLAAMCAQATAAAAGELLAHGPVDPSSVTYPSELVSAQIKVINQGGEQR